MSAPDRKIRVTDALEKVEMAHRAKHLPSQLSGGQQQRVAVARAVGGQPSILLADEPTGNLDSKNGEAVMDLLRDLHREGATICMVTHDPRYARHAQRSIRLFDGKPSFPVLPLTRRFPSPTFLLLSRAWWHDEQVPRPMTPPTGSPRPVRLLVADDQPDVVAALRLLLKSEGHDVVSASSPAGAMAAIGKQDFDAALIDLNYTRDTTSGQEGLDLLGQIIAIDADLPVIVMTAWGSVELAVEAMRRGASDFVQKPWDNARLVAIVRTQVELARALSRGGRLEAENRLLRHEEQLPTIAEAPSMQPILELIARVGPSDANVLIQGGNGTGKGLVAHALHQVSGRASRPLVTVNGGGVSEGVFESSSSGT